MIIDQPVKETGGMTPLAKIRAAQACAAGWESLWVSALVTLGTVLAIVLLVVGGMVLS